MSAVIFNGAKVKTLAPGIQLKDEAAIYSGSLDPTISGFAGVDGDVYISTSTRKIYQKNGVSTTAWDTVVTSGSFTPYADTFNNTSDWGSPSLGVYTITVLAVTHGKGLNPSIQTFELNGSDYEQNTVDQVLVNNSGDVSIKVPASPDLRFTGKVIIL